MKPLFLLLCLAAGEWLYAQDPLPDFGVYSNEEYQMKSCRFDTNAGAVVLLDEAVGNHDDEWRLITNHRVRIKIFDKRELSQGDIRIRFYADGGFESITDIQGITTNYEEGSPKSYALDRKTIFTEKEDKLYSSIRFAMPNVKPGSIIEYSYQSTKKHYGGLRPWVFQRDIPTVLSRFTLTLLPGSEFAYTVQKSPNYPIRIQPFPQEGKVYFEMNNIPGLVFEPFMDAVKDYLQRVEFQLAAYTRYGSKTQVNQTWKDLAYDLATDHNFGGAIRKDLPGTDEVKLLVAAENSDSGRVAAIYRFVRDRFKPTPYYSIYATDGIRHAWEKRSGTATEINMILMNLLQSFHFECYPLLAAERDFGKIDTAYPFIDRFNKVVALVNIQNHFTILDASEKFCPPFLTPYSLLNTQAFLVDKKNYTLVKVVTNNHAYRNEINIAAELNKEGLLKGEAEIRSLSYARLMRAEAIIRDRKKFVTDVLQEPGSEWQIDDLTVENLDQEQLPLLQKLKFHEELNPSGGFALVNFNRLTGFVKNPFTASERFTNVNFGYPYHIQLNWQLNLPPGSVIDKLPADKVVIDPNHTTQVSRVIQKEGDRLIVRVIFRQQTTLVLSRDYPDLTTLYSQINELLNEPIVVRLPK